MSETEKGGEQQALQKQKSGLIEGPLRGLYETVEAAASRVSAGVQAEEEGWGKTALVDTKVEVHYKTEVSIALQ